MLNQSGMPTLSMMFLFVASLLVSITTSNASSPLPTFLSKRVGGMNKKSYTPLVFFTVPKDIIPECDEMEKVIKQVENELGVRVERLDILRDEGAEALLSSLTKRSPPFLYNRESLQVISIPTGSGPGSSDDEEEEGSSVNKADIASKINKERVRAWAKGRFLPALSATASGSAKTGGKKPLVLQSEDNAIDQKELLDEMYMTPSQKSGKEAIQRRTEEKAAAAAASK